MAKRRTKKEKIEAERPFTIAWEPRLSTTAVKGQKIETGESTTRSTVQEKNSAISALNLNLGSIKSDLLKSVFVSSFILTLELVIYFFWK